MTQDTGLGAILAKLMICFIEKLYSYKTVFFAQDKFSYFNYLMLNSNLSE